MNFFLKLIDHIDKNDQHTYLFCGLIQFRFFKTAQYDCISEYKNFTLYKLKKLLNNGNDLLCSSFNHYDTTRKIEGFVSNNKNFTYNYTFIDEDVSNITHVLNTPLGYFDRSGIIINLSSYKYIIFI
jgi:hypothetical protein